MTTEPYGYGLWLLVIINAGIFLVFALSFTRPRTARDWRSFGAFAAFIVALFTEMYGFPLTIYLLSGWLGSQFPALGTLTHNSGHLWQALFGWEGDPHFNPLHLLSNVIIGSGMLIIVSAWGVLYRAQKAGRLAETGLYASVRHPQYVGFMLIMTGFLLQWPTITSLLMYPILVVVYVRLAHREERDAASTFGEAYRRYAAQTPGFVPRPRWPASRTPLSHR